MIRLVVLALISALVGMAVAVSPAAADVESEPQLASTPTASSVEDPANLAAGAPAGAGFNIAPPRIPAKAARPPRRPATARKQARTPVARTQPPRKNAPTPTLSRYALSSYVRTVECLPEFDPNTYVNGEYRIYYPKSVLGYSYFSRREEGLTTSYVTGWMNSGWIYYGGGNTVLVHNASTNQWKAYDVNSVHWPYASTFKDVTVYWYHYSRAQWLYHGTCSVW